ALLPIAMHALEPFLRVLDEEFYAAATSANHHLTAQVGGLRVVAIDVELDFRAPHGDEAIALTERAGFLWNAHGDLRLPIFIVLDAGIKGFRSCRSQGKIVGKWVRRSSPFASSWLG